MMPVGRQGGRAVLVARAEGFTTFRATGRRGNAAIQGGFEVALLRAGGVGAVVLGLRVGTGAKEAECRIVSTAV